MSGFTDRPASCIDDDAFGVEKYISGLSEFIKECNTPVTIAIQGDWGSGKTSMMNMIKGQLGDKVVTSWFNTWQYSQFNMGDSLAVSFLSRLISELVAGKEKSSENTKKALKIILRIAQAAGVALAENIFGEKTAEKVEKLGAVKEELDMPQAINDLKNQFQAIVDDKIKENGKTDRLVVFVDDLDRLHPGKAVELLEVLKLFLDCRNCVFVLAIDYGVVSQGVKQKYGELIGEEKGRSFFDKIIQVPFKMPVAQYDVKNYVKTSLQTLGMEILNGELDSYVKLIQRSVGCNPRAMKRLFNAFLLLNKIAANGMSIEVSQRKMLFAILCMQLSFENLYNYIVQNADECYNETFLQSLSIPDTYTEGNEVERLSHELNINNDNDIASVADFMQAFIDVIDQDGDGKLAEEEIRAFIDILRFSTITANSSNTTNAESEKENHYRYYNREIIKEVLNNIQGNITGPFKLYQTRTNNNPKWKKYYACGWKSIPTLFGNVNFEFKIETSLKNKESSLSVWIYATEKTDRLKFVEHMEDWYNEQRYGFVFIEEYCGYWLNDKIVSADARDEIIHHFTTLIPSLVDEIETKIKN